MILTKICSLGEFFHHKEILLPSDPPGCIQVTFSKIVFVSEPLFCVYSSSGFILQVLSNLFVSGIQCNYKCYSYFKCYL